MKELLLPFFEPLKNLNPIVYVIVIAFVPLIELRGSIPVALLMLKMSVVETFLWSVLGSMIPAFFVIPLFAWFLDWLEKKQLFPWLTNFLNKKFVAKAKLVDEKNKSIANSDKPLWQKELLKFWAIVTFVAIPLPGTGVWTGSAIASIIKMPIKKAFLAVLLGDVIAGLIVTAITLIFKS